MSGGLTRVVFMGTPEFAVPTLEMLADLPHVDVVSVYTSPDAVSSRGKSLTPSAVNAVASQRGLSVRTPTTLRDPGEVAYLASLEPDLFVVAAYGFILPKEVLAIPRAGSVNIHASLLPKWRGAAPIQRAILAGDLETGVSLMRMEEGLDTGDYCAQVAIPLDDDRSFDDIQMALAHAGAYLLKEHLGDIIAGSAYWIAQDEQQVTYAEKIDKGQILLHPNLTADELHNRVCASNRRAPARMHVLGKDIHVLGADKVSAKLLSIANDMKQGTLRIAEGTVLLAGSNPSTEVLVLKSVKPAGKREMTALQWAHGIRVKEDVAWE